MSNVCGGVILVSCDVSTADVSYSEASDVESDVVAGLSLVHHGVVHLDALDLSRLLAWVEHDCLSWVEDSSLDLADGDGSNSANLVDILDR